MADERAQREELLCAGQGGRGDFGGKDVENSFHVSKAQSQASPYSDERVSLGFSQARKRSWAQRRNLSQDSN